MNILQGIANTFEFARDSVGLARRDYADIAAEQHVKGVKENLSVARLALRTTLDFKERDDLYEDTLLLGKCALQEAGMSLLDLGFSEAELDELRRVL